MGWTPVQPLAEQNEQAERDSGDLDGCLRWCARGIRSRVHKSEAQAADTVDMRAVAVAVAVLVGCGVTGPDATAAATGPRAGSPPEASAAVPGTNCAVFPADNVWNMDISALPVNAKSKTWKRSMSAGTTLLHPDFGAHPYGFPIAVVNASTPTMSVEFYYPDESDPGPYPLTASTPIEDGSDHHALMVNKDTCVLFEIYDTDWNGGASTAGSGAVFDLGSNALRPAGWTSADAAGLPIVPGLVRYDEVQAKSVDHAIRFTVDCTSDRYIWPARHRAASGGRACPPMGARFRLKESYDISRFSADAQVILRAMKTYGLIVADNGADWYFQGTEDARWTDALLDQLKTVPARKFHAVDESGCRVSADSAAFTYGPSCPAPA